MKHGLPAFHVHVKQALALKLTSLMHRVVRMQDTLPECVGHQAVRRVELEISGEKWEGVLVPRAVDHPIERAAGSVQKNELAVQRVEVVGTGFSSMEKSPKLSPKGMVL